MCACVCEKDCAYANMNLLVCLRLRLYVCLFVCVHLPLSIHMCLNPAPSASLEACHMVSGFGLM